MKKALERALEWGLPRRARSSGGLLTPPLQSLIRTQSVGHSHLEKLPGGSSLVVTKAHVVHGQFYPVKRIRLLTKVDQHVQMSQRILVLGENKQDGMKHPHLTTQSTPLLQLQRESFLASGSCPTLVHGSFPNL